MINKLRNLFRGRNRCCSSRFTARAGSVVGQLAELDTNVGRLADTISKLGLWVRDDGVIVGGPMPPVNSLSDAVDFANERVLVVTDLVESLANKLGAVI